jgi:F0F1-type ATP synthase assembly protein I
VTTRLLAAGAAFAATVIGGFLVGIILARQTGGSAWPLIGLLVGLVAGVAAIVVALRPFLAQR